MTDGWGEDDSTESLHTLDQYYGYESEEGDVWSETTEPSQPSLEKHSRGSSINDAYEDPLLFRARRAAHSSEGSEPVVHLGNGSCPLSCYLRDLRTGEH